MKQSTLTFAAAKRTASSNIGKPNVSSTVAFKPKTSRPVTKPTKQRESSEDEIDEYDDIVLKESSGEDIEGTEAVDSKPSVRVDAAEVLDTSSTSVDDTEPPIRKTRIQTKKSLPSAPPKARKEKSSNVETPQPFKVSNLKTEDLQKKVEANTIESDILPELDPTSKRWIKLHKVAKAKLGGVPSMFLSYFFGLPCYIDALSNSSW